MEEGHAGAVSLATKDGRVRQGYRQAEAKDFLVLRDPATGQDTKVARDEIEAIREDGSLMPEGLAEAMTPAERRDLIRFLLDLTPKGGASADEMLKHAHAPVEFAYDRAPIHPEDRPAWQHPVNRERLYDFYAKEAAAFLGREPMPPLLPQFPGLDGAPRGHWGNQNEDFWADLRWNATDLGNLLSGVFHGAGLVVNKAVCVRLGDKGEMSACFNPETLQYEAVWTGGFVKFSKVRHGFMDGLLLDGKPLERPAAKKPEGPFVYHGFYRHGKRVVFAYRLGDEEMLDAPWVEDGQFTRVVGPAKDHPLRDLTRGGPSRWPEVLTTKGKLGTKGPYAIDTIEPPFENPWKALPFFGDHDFTQDGTAFLCTMQGDVWKVDGLDGTLEKVRWKRYATGLHQALGLVVADGKAHVLGRDQITRLHDYDGDGEADYYECVSNAYDTSPAGHDFICGLQRDAAGNFYTVSGKQGLLRISPDGKKVDVLATGFRNPDGLGLSPDGTITVPNSEGEWTPASMVCEVKPGGHYGQAWGRRAASRPTCRWFIGRGGARQFQRRQVFADSDRFGPLGGHWLHFSFGAGSYFLLLREAVDGQSPVGPPCRCSGEFPLVRPPGPVQPHTGCGSTSPAWPAGGLYTPLDGCCLARPLPGRSRA